VNPIVSNSTSETLCRDLRDFVQAVQKKQGSAGSRTLYMLSKGFGEKIIV
jgi:hypothetical protein